MWYVTLPCAAYATLSVTALILPAHADSAFFVIGGVALGLLLIGIATPGTRSPTRPLVNMRRPSTDSSRGPSSRGWRFRPETCRFAGRGFRRGSPEGLVVPRRTDLSHPQAAGRFQREICLTPVPEQMKRKLR